MSLSLLCHHSFPKILFFKLSLLVFIVFVCFNVINPLHYFKIIDWITARSLFKQDNTKALQSCFITQSWKAQYYSHFPCFIPLIISFLGRVSSTEKSTLNKNSPVFHAITITLFWYILCSYRNATQHPVQLLGSFFYSCVLAESSGDYLKRIFSRFINLPLWKFCSVHSKGSNHVSKPQNCSVALSHSLAGSLPNLLSWILQISPWKQ